MPLANFHFQFLRDFVSSRLCGQEQLVQLVIKKSSRHFWQDDLIQLCYLLLKLLLLSEQAQEQFLFYAQSV